MTVFKLNQEKIVLKIKSVEKWKDLRLNEEKIYGTNMLENMLRKIKKESIPHNADI